MRKYLIQNIATALEHCQLKTFSISVSIKAGSMYETVNGTAHMLDHLIVTHIKSSAEYNSAEDSYEI